MIARRLLLAGALAALMVLAALPALSDSSAGAAARGKAATAHARDLGRWRTGQELLRTAPELRVSITDGPATTVIDHVRARGQRIAVYRFGALLNVTYVQWAGLLTSGTPMRASSVYQNMKLDNCMRRSAYEQAWMPDVNVYDPQLTAGAIVAPTPSSVFDEGSAASHASSVMFGSRFGALVHMDTVSGRIRRLKTFEVAGGRRTAQRFVSVSYAARLSVDPAGPMC